MRRTKLQFGSTQMGKAPPLDQTLNIRPGGGGGGVLPIMAYTGGAPPERGTFFTLQVYERVGISRVEVYERVGKCVI